MIREELFNKPQLDQLCKELLAGRTVEVDGYKLKVKITNLNNPTKSPCWSCTCKFGYSRKICQLCIHFGNVMYLQYKKTECYYLEADYVQ